MPDICVDIFGAHARYFVQRVEWAGVGIYLQRRRRVRLRGGDRGREPIVHERLLVVLVRRVDHDRLPWWAQTQTQTKGTRDEWKKRNDGR